ncbi:MAG TPA: alpha/beta fold hydrolase [Acidimicrobiia bacterium]|nr:alpha/beta fold hydrolase [Acidimicrobiia bacterium]
MSTKALDLPGAREGHIPVRRARLYYRDIGEGMPIVILHGGPDFDHCYLLPEMDRLADSFRLIYYDQRGRGRSAEGVQAEEVGIRSDVEDLESIRRWFDLDSFAVLGHSWGGILAMEYVISHPDHVSQLILMNTAPASHQDLLQFREYLGRIRPAGDIERMESIRSTDRYQDGDLDAEAEYYRIHYRPAVQTADHVELVIGRLRTHFDNESVRKARAIEYRLYDQTWSSPDYDLVPALSRLDIPTLVLHGDDDFVPIGASARVAEGMRRGCLSVLPGGHFSYLEFPDLVRSHITSFMQGT